MQIWPLIFDWTVQSWVVTCWNGVLSLSAGRWNTSFFPLHSPKMWKKLTFYLMKDVKGKCSHLCEISQNLKLEVCWPLDFSWLPTSPSTRDPKVNKQPNGEQNSQNSGNMLHGLTKQTHWLRLMCVWMCYFWNMFWWQIFKPAQNILNYFPTRMVQTALLLDIIGHGREQGLKDHIRVPPSAHKLLSWHAARVASPPSRTPRRTPFTTPSSGLHSVISSQQMGRGLVFIWSKRLTCWLRKVELLLKRKGDAFIVFQPHLNIKFTCTFGLF